MWRSLLSSHPSPFLSPHVFHLLTSTRQPCYCTTQDWSTIYLSASPTNTITRLHGCIGRMKIAKACHQCRVGKRKCPLDASQGKACSPCNSRGLPCSLARTPRTKPVSILPPPSVLSAATGQEEELDTATKVLLVKLYLDRIHDKPHTLFHPPSLLQSVEQGTVSIPILYGILAISAR